MKFDFKEISFIPSITIDIIMDDVYIHNRESKLPLFAHGNGAVGKSNYVNLTEKGLNIVFPKNTKVNDLHLNRLGRYYVINNDYGISTKEDLFMTYDLVTFIKIFIKNGKVTNAENFYINLETSNPYSPLLINTVKEAKNIYGDNIKIMTGKISNPETFIILTEIGVDYIIIGNHIDKFIGYPIASLIKECYVESTFLERKSKIVVDIKNPSIDDIVKSIGLGADFVMIKNPIINMVESDLDLYSHNKLFGKIKLNKSKINSVWGKKEIYSEIGNIVNLRLDDWLTEFKEKLTLAMYFSNKKNLSEFIGNSEFVFSS